LGVFTLLAGSSRGAGRKIAHNKSKADTATMQISSV
jgi:hypothetical protein